MPFKTLNFDVQNGVAKIQLNRPDAANAVNLEMGQELMQAALRCDEDAGIRAVLITGTGKIFCAGGDLRAFESHGDELPLRLKELTTYLHAAVSRFVRGDAPVITAVNGAAGGAGFSLAIAGDLVYASEKARFTMAYTQVGLTPDGSSTYFLPRIVGVRKALELALTNRVLTAQEALEWGLVNEVVAPDELMARAEAQAAALAQGPTKAFGEAKRLMREGLEGSLETQMELEARAIAAAGARPDGREGIKAFLEKRKADFKGQ